MPDIVDDEKAGGVAGCLDNVGRLAFIVHRDSDNAAWFPLPGFDVFKLDAVGFDCKHLCAFILVSSFHLPAMGGCFLLVATRPLQA